MWVTAWISLFYFLAWPLPETAMDVLICDCLVGASPYAHYVRPSFPLRGDKEDSPRTKKKN